jgi:hypothetical protein
MSHGCSFLLVYSVSVSRITRKLHKLFFTITGLWAGRSGFNFRGGREFFFSSAFRPVLGPTQPPIERLRLTVSPEVKLHGA